MKELYPGFASALIKAQTNVYGKILSDNVISAYSEPHRYWHGLKHLQEVFTRVVSYGLGTPDQIAMLYAAIYHDVVYDSYSSNNEEKSVQFMRDDLLINNTSILSKDIIDAAAQYILDTKNLNVDNMFTRIDRSLFTSTNVKDYIDYGKAIWKEYNRYDWKDFLKEHIKIVRELMIMPAAAQYISILESHKPSAAIYPGSFNPYHIGHKSIADKIDKMFDKVIIAKGLNADKMDVAEFGELSIYDRRPYGNYQGIEFYGMLSDLYTHYSKYYNVTIVKGIRNSTDLEYEKVQERFLKELLPEINIIYIFADAKYEHISSSALRNLTKYDRPIDNYIP